MEDSEYVTNTLQLKLNLLTRVASAILTYWASAMPPEQTAGAAAHSDDAVSRAIAAVAATADSPPERAALALATSKLTAKLGGLRASNHVATAPAAFVATFRYCWTMCRAANADLAALPLDVPTPGSAIESFTSAYTTILTTAADVRRRHAACGGTVHWVDGSRHTPYRPTLAHPRPNSLPDTAAAMFGDAVTVPTSRFSQRALTAIFNTAAWLDVKAAWDAFDEGNGDADVAHREGARLVSYSQEGSAAALARPPDLTLPSSIISSANTRSLVQRKLGLYISGLVAPLMARAAAAGHAPTQYELLGDAAINVANSSTRHKGGLYAYYHALRAVVPPTGPPAPVQLCDRGDGSPQTKEEARQR